MSDGTAGWFRTRPPSAPAHGIPRLRLLGHVRHRFDVPLTVVVGGAGYGKTTLLAQAVHENELEPSGRDVWLLLGPRDRNPEHLMSGLGAALVGDPEAVDGVDEVVDLLLVEAPDQVALVLDV